MLELAINHKDELNKAYQSAIRLDRNRFYIASSWSDYEIKIDDSDYYNIQYVSVDKSGCIVGYYCASIDRCANIITNISVINFKQNTQTSVDLFSFLTMIKNLPVIKIEWWVARGNKAEKMYDAIIQKYGGSKVGVYRKSVKLKDGKYYDKVMYEIMLPFAHS